MCRQEQQYVAISFLMYHITDLETGLFYHDHDLVNDATEFSTLFKEDKYVF